MEYALEAWAEVSHGPAGGSGYSRERRERVEDAAGVVYTERELSECGGISIKLAESREASNKLREE